MTNAVVHWEIGGPDLAVLRDFYTKAFGWSVDDARADYALVQPVGNGTGGGLMQTREDMPPYVTIYVDVDNLETAMTSITGLGGTLLVPPTKINDSLSFALFQDPVGNTVGLLQAASLDAG